MIYFCMFYVAEFWVFFEEKTHTERYLFKAKKI
jgi:hypothetical protein